MVALAAIMSAFTGCTYLQYRAEDAVEIMDLGITVSAKPGFALWFAAPFSLGAGLGGYVDGHFIGLGGGQIGMTRHYLAAVGVVLFGYEEIGWGEFDKDDPTTLCRTYQGVIGIPISLATTRPDYMPTCNHEIHLGWIGLIGNLRYTEILDFIVGFTTLDIAGDDGNKMGHWPWQSEDELTARAAAGDDSWPW